MSTEDVIDLSHFSGELEFSGIAVDEEVNEQGDLYLIITLILNDTMYTFEEDPLDGLRSSLGDVYIDYYKEVLDIFSPVLLIGSLQSDGEGERLVDFIDYESNEVVVRIGTMDQDQEYPFFVFEYFPEHLTGIEGIAEDYDY